MNRYSKLKAMAPQVRKLLGYIPLFLLAVAIVLIVVLIASSSANKAAQEKLQKDIDGLSASIAELTEENDSLRAMIQEKDSAMDALRADQGKLIHAMDLFWQIDEAYALGRVERCRDLIRLMESQVLAPCLPTTSTTDNGRFSPYDRYAEICQNLGETYGAGVKAQ